MGVILELKNITKEYPGVTALNNVSMSFETGKVHAIMGENGAGKSTLIKAISGAVRPNSGSIIFEGAEYPEMTPMLSQKLGIGVIYQEFNLVPELSVADNIFLGRRVNDGVVVDKKLMRSKAREIIEEFGIDLDVTLPVKKLTVAYQQLVEIAKSISNEVKVLIMDEPSAPLTNREIDAMFGIVNKLREKGIAIVYISHRMDEVLEISDTVSVMRDGEYIGTKNTADTNRQELIAMMVGRSLNEQYPEAKRKIGNVVLEAKNLSTPALLKNVSLSVREGEILGLAGLVGAGRTETARVIYGADPTYSGDIIIDGKKLDLKKPKDGIDAGVALIPEDRKKHGALLEMSIRENISFISIKDISKASVVDVKKDRELSQSYIERLRIKTPSMEQHVKNLSGGNQQKVVLAKSLAGKSKVMIFDEPTRGIDVGAKHEIYLLMNELAQGGMAIIMISSEMPELLGMADRIIVMHEGEVMGELSKEEATQTRILELASGK